MNAPKFSDMSKEQIKKIIVKKKECDVKALQIVERLIENPVPLEWFYCSLKFINQCHLQDVIEERAISKICGYPICLNKLGLIPQQKYSISTRQNKVYDIDERKNFCSNQCYKAAIFIKDQMLTSPLWLRDKEEIPHFQLLSLETSGCIGVEVNLGVVRVDTDSSLKSFEDVQSLKKIVKNATNDDPVPVNYFLNKNLSEDLSSKLNLNKEVNEINESKSKVNETDTHTSFNKMDKTIDQFSQNMNSTVIHVKSNESKLALQENIKKTSAVKLPAETSKLSDVLKKKNSANQCVLSKKKNQKSLEEITAKLKAVKERRIKLIDPLPMKCSDSTLLIHDSIKEQALSTKNEEYLKNISKKIPAGISVEYVVHYIEKCVFEWVTTETLTFLKDKQPDDNTSEYKSGLNYENFNRNLDMRIGKRYLQLCKNIKSLEIEENKFDKSVVPNELKPVPEFEILKKQSQQLQLKVKSFFKGKLEIDNCEESSSDPPDIRDTDDVSVHLPLIDFNSQLVLRRRIIFNCLNKIVLNILQLFGVDTVDVLSQLYRIILTFNLTSKNVLFKPYHLNLLSIIIIKMLSEKYIGIKKPSEKPTSIKYVNILLSTYNLPEHYLNNLIKKIYDV